MPGLRDLDHLVRVMHPVLRPGVYAFVELPTRHRVDPAAIVATLREPEGLSAIVAEEAARAANLVPHFLCRWITLSVHSDLASVGLTARFSSALARAGIACNVVAGTRHDHLFVPAAVAERAMAVLASLQHGRAAA